jgi:hypothetical protein
MTATFSYKNFFIVINVVEHNKKELFAVKHFSNFSSKLFYVQLFFASPPLCSGLEYQKLLFVMRRYKLQKLQWFDNKKKFISLELTANGRKRK